MRVTRSLTVSGTTDDVAAAIQTALLSRRRIHDIEWVKPNRHVRARVNSFPLTYGDVLDVCLEPIAYGRVQIDLLSETAQMFDWGACRRNIERVVVHLSNSGYS